MTEPISRRALEEAWTDPARHLLTFTDTIRAILDAPFLDWCEVHDSKAATPLIAMGPMKIGMCQQYSLTPSEGQDRCQFATYARVKVGP